MSSGQTPSAILDSARATLRAIPENGKARLRFAQLLRRMPDLIQPGDTLLFLPLLSDPAIAPQSIATTGWTLLEKTGGLPGPDADPEHATEWVEQDDLALTLLSEAPVTSIPIELMLNAVRRWLLLADRARYFPNTVAALVRQASLNGGAWPFDAAERAALRAGGPMVQAYLPPRPYAGHAPDPTAFAAPVTRAVAAQYEAWPYPAWERVTARPDDTLTTMLAALGPEAPARPPRPDILVAGCGTGREAVRWASRAPDGRILAIDLSAASLRYAADRCGGIGNIVFEQRDLHDVAGLDRRFDVIACSGVLHHLADPEAGWAALADVLKPGGVMRIMLYSKVSRLLVDSARLRIADLLGRPIDDDLLREVRARLIADPAHPIVTSGDFHDLGGVHDLLLHAHEDSFDIPRIRSAIDRLGLDFLGFELPLAARQSYRAEHPHDPWCRDFAGWAAIERHNPQMFSRMYRFWCARPSA